MRIPSTHLTTEVTTLAGQNNNDYIVVKVLCMC